MKKITLLSFFMVLFFVSGFAQELRPDINDLLNRLNNLESSPEKEPSGLFTANERNFLQDHFNENTSRPIGPMRAPGDVFAYDSYFACTPAQFGVFPVLGPYTVAPIATLSAQNYAGDFDGNDNLYAVNNATLSLLTIDTSTGVETTIGPLTNINAGHTITGLAWNASNTTMYASSTNGTITTIYSVNLATGTLTPIGNTGNSLGIWLAIDSAGNAFMADVGTDNLYSINLATGAGTLVGSLGININFAQDADFDPDTDILYMGGYLGGGVNNFYSVNTATGLATSLGTVNANCAELTIVAIQGTPSGSPVSECATDTPLPLGPAAGTVTTSITNITSVGNIGNATGDFVLNNVTLSLTHTWGSDLEIRLESPSGTVLMMSDNRGGSNSLDANPTEVIFDDNAPASAATWPNVVNPNVTFFPEGGLFNTVFAGEPITGDWTLTLTDTFNSDGGTLFDYCIEFTEIIQIGDPPQIVCPLDITVNTSDYPPDDCGAQVFFANAQAFDPEDGLIPVTQTMGPGTGSVFPVGVTIIEFSATDSDGNTSTCQFTITVVDDVDPVAVCQAITVELDASGTVTIDAADLDGGSSDLCTGVNFSFDMAGTVTTMMLDCADLGENTITLYVTDGEGNVVSCEATVTVEDNIAPVIVCNNAGGLQSVSEDFDSGLPAGWAAVTNTGPCDWQNGNLPAGWLGGQFTFPTPAMFFNDDACGSGAAASNATLFSDVYDTNGATSLELTYDVAYRHLGGSSFTVEVFDGATWQNVATYNANTPVTTAGPFDLLAFANSDFQVRYTYDDGGGWQWGAAVDNFLLEYETPAGVIPQYFLDANGEVTVPITDLYSSATDNCTVIVSAGGATGGTPEVLTTGFAGGNGNFGNFFDINALETVTISSFDLNLDTGANLDIEIYFKEGTWVGSQTTPGDWTLIGTAPGTVSAGDGVPTVLDLNLGQVIEAGETGAFYITAPVLSGGGFNYTNGTGTGNIWASDDNIEFLEGGAVGGYFTGSLFQPRVFNGNIHYTAGSGSTGDLTFTCADLGIVNITVTATDAAGNSTSCVAQIEIIDNIAPVVVGEDITVELGPDGTVCIEPEDLFGIIPPLYNVITISSDNGSGAEGWTDLVVDVTESVTVSFDWSYTTMDGPNWDQFGYLIDGVFTQLTDNTGANNQTGNTSVPLTAGQEFGFRARSEDGLFGPATITVSDFMPGFTGQFDPSNWTEVLTNSDGSAVFVEIAPGTSSAFDNCEITVTAIDISCFTCADIGNPVTVTIFVSDASGNIASSTAVVTVVDLLGPEIMCPADMTVDTDPNSITYTLPDYFGDGIATATDNCTDPVTILSQDPAPGTLLLDGVYTITLTAEDEYGNESVCSFELTVDTILGDDDNALADAIIMYPNPAEAYVSIRNNSQIGLTEANIYDINGKLVSKFDLTKMSGEQRLDVSDLASGVYLVYIQSETANVVKRLIKK